MYIWWWKKKKIKILYSRIHGSYGWNKVDREKTRQSVSLQKNVKDEKGLKEMFGNLQVNKKNPNVYKWKMNVTCIHVVGLFTIHSTHNQTINHRITESVWESLIFNICVWNVSFVWAIITKKSKKLRKWRQQTKS